MLPSAWVKIAAAVPLDCCATVRDGKSTPATGDRHHVNAAIGELRSKGMAQGVQAFRLGGILLLIYCPVAACIACAHSIPACNIGTDPPVVQCCRSGPPRIDFTAHPRRAVFRGAARSICLLGLVPNSLATAAACGTENAADCVNGICDDV